MLDWGSIFRDAHLRSWPTASLSISVAAAGGRSIYRDDRAKIDKAACEHGYMKIFSSPKIVMFKHPTKKGELY